MDHVQISVGDGGSWKPRSDEKMKELREKDFTRREDEDAGALQLREFKGKYVMENIIMDSEIHDAIKNGDPDKFVDALEEVCEKKKLPFDEIFWQESHGNDTLLHVAAKYGSDKIAELVAYHDHNLLKLTNIKGNIPLHEAARSTEGGSNVIKVILSQSDAHITRSKNRVGNTALHEAVACGNLDGVTELYHRDKAVAHELNNANKSPLYIAVYNYMRWDNNIIRPNQGEEKNTVKAIVDCLLHDSLAKSMTDIIWSRGRSPLHAAIEAVSDKRREQSFGSVVKGLHRCWRMFDCAKRESSSEARLRDLVKKRPEMIWLKDENGRTPLHYAALCGYRDGVRIMLESYPEAVLEFDIEGNLPIHLACKFGTIDVVKELLGKEYIYAGPFLNQSGQNILHAAAMGGKHDIVKYILTTSERININLNETDRDGNTPLHVASKNMHPMVLLYLTRDKRIDLQRENRKGLMARDIVLQQSRRPMKYSEFLSHAILSSANAHCSERLEELRPTFYDLNRMKDLVNTLMLVAILIATVTFAAGFTVPGSVYGSDDPNPQQKGVAVLAKRRVFQIFMVCNTVAMYSSTVGSFFLLWAQLGDYHLARNSFNIALHMVALALMTMSGAFMAAAHLVVPNVFGLTIAITAIGAISILFISAAYILLFFSFESHRPFLRRVSNIFFWTILQFAGSYENHDKK